MHQTTSHVQIELSFTFDGLLLTSRHRVKVLRAWLFNACQRLFYISEQSK